MTFQELERARLERQRVLDTGRTARERNELGQFATPPALAEEIVRLAVEHLEPEERISFLDPAIGSGVFYSALLRCVSPSRINSANGVERDSRFVEVATDLWGRTGLKITLADFLSIDPPPPGRRANLLFANPPYVRHHHISSDEKARLKRLVQERVGITISGLAGLYVPFLLASRAWMNDGALAAWLIPSEWLSVNYGQAVKQFLLEKVLPIRIHVFEASDVQFGDALVSSAVIFFRNETPDPDRRILMTFGGGLAEPQATIDLALRDLSASEKWTQAALANIGSRIRPTHTTLGELFEIRRGIATGHNKFFIASRSEFLRLGIADCFLRPILPSSRYLASSVIESTPDGYPRVTSPLAVLDCGLSKEEIEDGYPDLWKYLRTETATRACNSYLASRRKPWYSQEHRAPAPYLATYMGREQTGRAPFRFFLNRSQAVATNAYQLLYPKPALAARLAATPHLQHGLLRLLDEIAAAGFREHGRVYGGVLHKLEPGELAALPADRVVDALELDLPTLATSTLRPAFTRPADMQRSVA
jgi:adenine-specific DNA-methyltransferase